MSDSAPPGTASVSPPQALAQAFGDHLGLAARYVDLLLTDGVRRGLIGPREHDRIWDRHLANSAALADLVPHGSRVVDVGSGAGLPGIPLAIVRPDLDLELLEPMQRRVEFLELCVDRLGLSRVAVRRGRAPEDLRSGAEAVAVARAVAPLGKLIAATRPLLDAGGTLLALKGRAAEAEMDTVRQLKLPVRLELLTTSFGDDVATVVRVRHLSSARRPTPHR